MTVLLFIRRVSAIFIGMIILSTAIAAEGSKGISNTPLTLATGQNYSPFVDDKLPNGGWSFSIVERVLDKLSLQSEMMFLPWGRALKWTSEEKIFGSFPYVYSAHRAETLLFSEPINYVPVHMYVSKFSEFSTLESLKNKRLCFPYDYALSPIEQGIVSKFSMTINRVKDGIRCIKHVQKGWSDAGLINEYIDITKLASLTLENKPIKIFTEQLALVPLHFVISKNRKNSKQWMNEFNSALKLINNNGERQAIDQQYYKLLNQH